MTADPPYDLAAHVTRFCRILRSHGLLAGPQESADALRAVENVGVMSESYIYWSLRSILAASPEDLRIFDDLFARFWNFRPLAPAPERPPSDTSQFGQTRTVGRLPRGIGVPQDDPDSDDTVIQLLRTGASARHVFGARDLSALDDPEDAAEIQRVADRIVRALASRPGRRRKPHRRRGTPDLRRAMRLSLSTGGHPVAIPRLRRARRVPRLLLLLDVSGSMDRHARLMLRLAHAVGQRAGRVETFAFSTALTRVTRELSAPNFAEALDRIAYAVNHWSGGTRIGECLRDLNTVHRRLQDRFTTVFLLSDGWETGDPADLARELARLRLRTRRLVWLNPLAASDDFQPLARGLRAAAPHVHLFLPADSVESLKRLPALLRT